MADHLRFSGTLLVAALGVACSSSSNETKPGVTRDASPQGGVDGGNTSHRGSDDGATSGNSGAGGAERAGGATGSSGGGQGTGGNPNGGALGAGGDSDASGTSSGGAVALVDAGMDAARGLEAGAIDSGIDWGDAATVAPPCRPLGAVTIASGRGLHVEFSQESSDLVADTSPFDATSVQVLVGGVGALPPVLAIYSGEAGRGRVDLTLPSWPPATTELTIGRGYADAFMLYTEPRSDPLVVEVGWIATSGTATVTHYEGTKLELVLCNVRMDFHRDQAAVGTFMLSGTIDITNVPPG